MPGNVFSYEATSQPEVPTSRDYSMLLVGHTIASPVPAGQVSLGYTVATAAASAFRAGDTVDALVHAITVTNDNPAPPAASVYSTPATVPGSYRAINTLAVQGTAIPTTDAGTPPLGTYQPWIEIVKGGTLGVDRLRAYASLDNGRTKLLVDLGTALEYTYPAADGWGVSGRAGFIFTPPAAGITATYAKLNSLKAAAAGVGHYVIVSGAPAIHGAADTTHDTALSAVADATDDATAATLYAAIYSTLAAHGSNTGGAYHGAPDTALAAALAAIDPTPATIMEIMANLVGLVSAYSEHIARVAGVHGTADAVNTVSAYVPINGTLLAGDRFFTSTLPPMWSALDLFNATDPDNITGAFAAAAKSSSLFAMIVITEPIVAANYNGTNNTTNSFGTVVAGLDYGLSKGRLWGAVCRFRDPMPGESRAQYVAAFRVFTDTYHDSRVTCLAGSAWITDPQSQRIYDRSFMAPYLARTQSFAARPGEQGEQIAQNPGWVARGPLPGVTLRDPGGNLIGHDEFETPGIDADEGSPIGRGVSLCYREQVEVKGTYVSDRLTVMYGIGEGGKTPMDRRVSNAVRQASVGVSLGKIGGADVVSPTVPRTLKSSIRDGLQSKIVQAVRRYANEFANAADANLVVVQPVVTVVGPVTKIAVAVKLKFYFYTGEITEVFTLER